MEVWMKKSQGLRGELSVPGDKSISHRSIMLGALAKGKTTVTNFLTGADCLSTIDCFRKMGIEIEIDDDRVTIHGKGLYGLSAPIETLNVGNSGTTTRLISGILSGQGFESVLSGDDSLNSRPMKRIIDPLQEMGAHIISMNGDGCAPLRIGKGQLSGIHYYSKVASAQVKSAILLAGLYAKGETSVTEPSLSRNHTELMLQQFGAEVIASTDKSTGLPTATVQPCSELYAQDINIPGDISSAAYFIAAGALVPGSQIHLCNVGINPTRAGLLKVCEMMGVNMEYHNEVDEIGEPTADLIIRSSKLKGCTIEGDLIPTLIDEIPIIAVMAACADGTTIIKDAGELKVKETNRIDTVTEGLKAMGADITPTEDGMIICGGKPLQGAKINSYLDHRIAMAFAIAGLAAEGETLIQDSQCIDVSYPQFFKTLDRLR